MNCSTRYDCCEDPSFDHDYRRDSNYQPSHPSDRTEDSAPNQASLPSVAKYLATSSPAARSRAPSDDDIEQLSAHREALKATSALPQKQDVIGVPPMVSAGRYTYDDACPFERSYSLGGARIIERLRESRRVVVATSAHPPLAVATLPQSPSVVATSAQPPLASTFNTVAAPQPAFAAYFAAMQAPYAAPQIGTPCSRAPAHQAPPLRGLLRTATTSAATTSASTLDPVAVPLPALAAHSAASHVPNAAPKIATLCFSVLAYQAPQPRKSRLSAPATLAPTPLSPATSAPATSTPATSGPMTSAPATSAPATSAPATSAPATSALAPLASTSNSVAASVPSPASTVASSTALCFPPQVAA